MAAQPERNYTADDIRRRCHRGSSGSSSSRNIGGRGGGSQSNGTELIIYNSVFACNS